MYAIPWNAPQDEIELRENHLLTMQRTAIFSRDLVYRYALTRVWDDTRSVLAIIGLNPSTATETVDDPTIVRCMGFARDGDYGGIVMLNLFAYRATNPRALYQVADPIGPLNDRALCAICFGCDVLCAWGVHGGINDRGLEVVQLLRDTIGEPRLLCLGKTLGGHPKHPLYLARSTRFMPFA